MLTTAAIVDSDAYYIASGDEVAPWAEAFASHSVSTLSLEDMGREIMLMRFIFRLRQIDEWRCWWSLPVLVSALDLDSSRCRSGFIHKFIQAWAAWLEKLGLGSGHLRRATTTEHAERGVMDAPGCIYASWRTLPHQAASSPVLLALCVKLATPVMKHRSEVQAARWTMLLLSLLALCKTTNQGQGYQLHVPTDPWSAVTPNNCQLLQVAADGTVDLEVLRCSEVWHAKLKGPAADMLSQLPPHCALIDLLRSSYQASGMRPWWVQLVLTVAEVLEGAALAKGLDVALVQLGNCCSHICKRFESRRCCHICKGQEEGEAQGFHSCDDGGQLTGQGLEVLLVQQAGLEGTEGHAPGCRC